MDRPLMIWCSSHRTLAQEEIPLYLDAGFRVVPLLKWTDDDAQLDRTIAPLWKHCVDLPVEVLRKLQELTFHAESGKSPFQKDEIDLLNKYVDVIYVTVFPNLAIRLAKVFHGTVIFRPFGHGALNNYSNISKDYGTSPEELSNCFNYHWVPILTTLQEIETPRICTNATHLGAYITENRLGNRKWTPTASEPYLVETIPRINRQQYYLDIYQAYRRDHGHLPLKLLGNNQPRGGDLDDPSIVGFVNDDEYFSTACRARLSIYHGRSKYHIHYHPIEFMAMGLPVLFHEDSAFSAEASHFGFSTAELNLCGMFKNAGQANKIAEKALQDPSIAEELSQRQQALLDRAFNRKIALNQARWLKTRVIQHKLHNEINLLSNYVLPNKRTHILLRITNKVLNAWKHSSLGNLKTKFCPF
jgi:hypothetical protein